MSALSIKVENLSKQYRLGMVGSGTLSHDVNRWWSKVRGKEDPYLKLGDVNNRSEKGKSDYVWALRDLNFEVEQGDMLGIIGKNGAGKSTLLKILSQVTHPTTGSVKMKGKIASLLEVGTGFQPELSGRENIFLNGAILGMSKSEIKRKFDEIVDFSGVERYIDTPVKRYSSGMYVRLAFAVAAHLESEILIVDEVLAVGDAEFQKKSLNKMDSINSKREKTVLFVSHNILLIQNLCRKAMLLENGLLKEFGPVNDVVARYNTKEESRKGVWEGNIGDENFSIIKSAVNDNYSNEPIKTDSNLNIEVTIVVHKKIRNINFGFIINSSFANAPILRALFNDFNDLNGLDTGTLKLVFQIPKHTLAAGSYGVNFLIGYPNIGGFDTSAIDLEFLLKSDTEYGNRYFAENAVGFNSIVRPNCFKEIVRLS